MRVLAACCAASLASIVTEANGSCGAAFCLINTDWSAQGALVEVGALGDVRVEARHEIFASRDDPSRIRSAGMIVGVKLPTGKFDVRNADGEEAERTLQPGTGTTDLILGAYWYSGNPLADTSWFARVQ